jgi:hypothetical protein
MALYRLGLSLLLVVLWGCGNQKTAGQTAPRPVVEVMPATKATADVDRRATLALKQSLMTNFPKNSSSLDVEAALLKDGYECGSNPAAPRERACLKAVREGVCEINTIVRSTPYAPEKAQVIKICEVGATAPKSE